MPSCPNCYADLEPICGTCKEPLSLHTMKEFLGVSTHAFVDNIDDKPDLCWRCGKAHNPDNPCEVKEKESLADRVIRAEYKAAELEAQMGKTKELKEIIENRIKAIETDFPGVSKWEEDQVQKSDFVSIQQWSRYWELKALLDAIKTA